MSLRGRLLAHRVVDAIVATVFLGSLWSARPLETLAIHELFVARLAPDFCPMTGELASRPRICRLLRNLTLMWGLVILVKGTVTLWLLLSLLTVDFVLIKSGTILTLTAAAVAATVGWSVVIGRKEGLLGRPRTELEPVPG